MDICRMYVIVSSLYYCLKISENTRWCTHREVVFLFKSVVAGEKMFTIFSSSCNSKTVLNISDTTPIAFYIVFILILVLVYSRNKLIKFFVTIKHYNEVRIS